MQARTHLILPGAPVIKRLDNASANSSGPVDISIPNVPNGAFVHDIAVNPTNGNEVLVVMSNYNIVGLYHSVDAGNSWEAVEGNLTGDNNPGSSNPGPSIRSAAIIPAEGGSIFVLGTSTGIYASQNLDGSNTMWGKESASMIGSSLVENIDSRFSDGDIAVGSHGRGIFVGSFQGEINFNAPDNSTVSQNFPNPFSTSTDTNIPVNFANRSRVTINIYNITGRKIMQPVIDQIYQPGPTNIPINFNSTHASGIYLYQIIAEPTDEGKKFVGTGKMTFIN
ncbi:MAG: T9SS type A sorting domain-containing protein [Balneolaceae bacterium]|nr:T9SS type A sorting domain-containing protein [Balneolaceae bacterium]